MRTNILLIIPIILFFACNDNPEEELKKTPILNISGYSFTTIIKEPTEYNNLIDTFITQYEYTFNSNLYTLIKHRHLISGSFSMPTYQEEGHYSLNINNISFKSDSIKYTDFGFLNHKINYIGSFINDSTLYIDSIYFFRQPLK